MDTITKIDFWNTKYLFRKNLIVRGTGSKSEPAWKPVETLCRFVEQQRNRHLVELSMTGSNKETKHLGFPRSYSRKVLFGDGLATTSSR